MNCSRNAIEAWLDDELDAAGKAAVEQHIAECPACAETATQLREQKTAIRAAAPYYRAPEELRASIRGALRAKEPAREPWRALAIAASVLLVASVVWNLMKPPSHLVQSLVDNHMRSLVASQMVDVPSSDQHTVKPWFAGKLDFSPDVRNFEAEGFPLVGGRVDFLAGRRVAALVYRRRQHVIDVFTWPDPSRSIVSRYSRNGYNILNWSAHGMTYWALSDAGMAELDKLRELYGR
jgi:anti-sigma factor RsiW